MKMMKKLFYFAFMAMLCCVFTACGNDDENEEFEEEKYTNAEKSKVLFNTSWRLVKRSTNGEIEYTNGPTFTFSNKGTVYPDGTACFELYTEGKRTSGWWIDERLRIHHNYYGDITASEGGKLGQTIGTGGYIEKLTVDEMITWWDSDLFGYNLYRFYYEAVNNHSGGGSSSYEKPDVGFYDFTATKTSLKVEYKIYNKDEAQVSSAKIYYGTSSNPSSSKSASVSGTLITANISGLKAGTTYYVKCVATGKGGTTTTSVTKCTTNY